MQARSLSEMKTELAFVRRAAEAFNGDPEMTSYTDGEIIAGVPIALRWGLSQDCVLVIYIDENVEPTVYGQALREVLD